MALYQPAVGSRLKPDAVQVTKRLLYKTRPCQFYEQGKCTRGERCTFAHGDYDAKACPDFSYTQMCREFMDTGACPRGSRCKFAHSTLKLRPWGRARGAGEPGNTEQAPQLPVPASVPMPCVTAPQTPGDRVECNLNLWPSVLKETETSVVSTEDELCCHARVARGACDPLLFQPPPRLPDCLQVPRLPRQNGPRRLRSVAVSATASPPRLSETELEQRIAELSKQLCEEALA